MISLISWHTFVTKIRQIVVFYNYCSSETTFCGDNFASVPDNVMPAWLLIHLQHIKQLRLLKAYSYNISFTLVGTVMDKCAQTNF